MLSTYFPLVSRKNQHFSVKLTFSLNKAVTKELISRKFFKRDPVLKYFSTLFACNSHRHFLKSVSRTFCDKMVPSKFCTYIISSLPHSTSSSVHSLRFHSMAMFSFQAFVMKRHMKFLCLPMVYLSLHDYYL